jgi:hypothetical protein
VSDEALAQFLAETCPKCGTPGPQRHLSAVGGCQTCADSDPRPVLIPARTQMEAAGVIAQQPMRNIVGRLGVRIATDGTARPVGCSADCYRLPSGGMVHVRPGCRC